MALLNETQQDYYDGNDFGGYQFISLDDIVNNFIISYVGENKIIPKVKRTDIAFHAQRAIQELSFDTFKSIKSQEITLPPSNTMVLPQDYVNYTKICWVDGNGIERPLYPTRHTSNPTPISQNDNGTYYSNLVLNSDFENGIDNWEMINVDTVGTGTQLNFTTSSDGILLSSNGLGAQSFPILQQPVTLVDGQTYQLSWNITSFDIPTGNISFFLYGGVPGGAGSYRPAGSNNTITATGAQTTIEFTFDASQNNGINDMMLAIQISNGNTVVKSVVVKDFLLARVNNDGNLGMSPTGTINSDDDSTTWNSYSSDTSNSTSDANAYNHDTDIYDLNIGQRYGLETSMAQGNGTYYIDNLKGLIHFSSNVSGKTVILKYISDGLGTNEEMVVHKFAEEAMYKSIAYAIFSTTISGQQLVPRFKKEKFAAIRQAKLRLSNIKIDELAQIMRGKSKWIKS